MLLELAQLAASTRASLFALFGYLTFRAILSALTALALSLWLGPAMIRRLALFKGGQPIRSDGPQTHFSKAGTPTMGGALILLTIAASVLLWGDLRNRYVWLVLAVMVAFGAIGWYDDWIKIVKRDPNGMKSRAEVPAAVAVRPGRAALFLYFTADVPAATTLYIPFFKIRRAAAGARQLRRDRLLLDRRLLQRGQPDRRPRRPGDHADGARGRALGVFAYASATRCFRLTCRSRRCPGRASWSIICAAIAGAGLGFLWFNTYPAMVFMGDIGALALGAVLGTIAVIVRQELVLVIMGGVFVIETLSVMIQVASLQDDRQARVPHGADPPPLRAQGLAGAARDRALLDHLGGARAGRPCHVEGALMHDAPFTARRPPAWMRSGAVSTHGCLAPASRSRRWAW